MRGSNRLLTDEIAWAQEGDCRFLPLFGDNGELYSTSLDIKHSIGRLALGEDRLLISHLKERPAKAGFSEKGLRIERHLLRRLHGKASFPLLVNREVSTDCCPGKTPN
jgi:hypothetical protein